MPPILTLAPFCNSSWMAPGLLWLSSPRSYLLLSRNTPPSTGSCFAAYSSLWHFRFLLEGRVFTIFTDHKPLTLALFRVSLPWSACQQRHLAYLAEFTSSIVRVPGIENVVADTLSRPSPVPEPVPTPVSASTASSLVSLHSSTDITHKKYIFHYMMLVALQVLTFTFTLNGVN